MFLIIFVYDFNVEHGAVALDRDRHCILYRTSLSRDRNGNVTVLSSAIGNRQCTTLEGYAAVSRIYGGAPSHSRLLNGVAILVGNSGGILLSNRTHRLARRMPRIIGTGDYDLILTSDFHRGGDGFALGDLDISSGMQGHTTGGGGSLDFNGTSIAGAADAQKAGFRLNGCPGVAVVCNAPSGLCIATGIVAVKAGNEENAGIKKLVELLKSDKVKQYINDTYDGAVIPVE